MIGAKDGQLDMFSMPITDVSLRDQQDTMEYPFFSLSKGRKKPIEYHQGDKFVKISPNVSHAIATIWDADIIIWAASAINLIRASGDEKAFEEIARTRTLKAHPTDILRSIGRGVGGRDIKELRDALERLTSTYIATSIRAEHQGRTHAGGFTWLDSWNEVRIATKKGEQTVGFSITLSNWIYQGIMDQRLLLTVEREYFELTGGYERWLWRLARKHAHGHPEGWKFSLDTLYQKSGSASDKKYFKRDLKRIVEQGCINGYGLEWMQSRRNEEPILRVFVKDKERPLAKRISAAKTRKSQVSVGWDMLEADPGRWQELLSQRLLIGLRAEFPNADLTDLMARFVAFNKDRRDEIKSIPAAFAGFVRRHLRKGRTSRW